MINYNHPPTRLSQYSRPIQVKNWLERQKHVASRLILVAINDDRLVIHEAATGEWLAKLDWSKEQIVITEAEDVSSPYEFRAFKSALGFLDALLLHYFIKTSEVGVKVAALAAPAC